MTKLESSLKLLYDKVLVPATETATIPFESTGLYEKIWKNYSAAFKQDPSSLSDLKLAQVQRSLCLKPFDNTQVAAKRIRVFTDRHKHRLYDKDVLQGNFAFWCKSQPRAQPAQFISAISPDFQRIAIKQLIRERSITNPAQVFYIVEKFQYKPDLLDWRFMLRGYSNKGYVEQALTTFNFMRENKKVSVFDYNSMINLYIKQKTVHKIKDILDLMHQKNAETYKLLYFHSPQLLDLKETSDFKQDLEQFNLELDLSSLEFLLKMYIKQNDIYKTRQIIKHLDGNTELEPDIRFYNHLMRSLVHSGFMCDLYDLLRLSSNRNAEYDLNFMNNLNILLSKKRKFAEIPVLEVLISSPDNLLDSIHSLLYSASRAGDLDKLKNLFSMACEQFSKRIPVLWFGHLLRAGLYCKDIKFMESVIDEMEKQEYSFNDINFCDIITAYSVAGMDEKAEEWFAKHLEQFGKPQLKVVNKMISHYRYRNRPNQVLQMLELLDKNGQRPDAETIFSLMEARASFSSRKDPVDSQVHQDQTRKMIETLNKLGQARNMKMSHKLAYSALKAHDNVAIEALFENLNNHSIEPDLVLHNILMRVYIFTGKKKEFQDAFNRALERLEQFDIWFFNVALLGYSVFEDLGHVDRIMKLVSKNGCAVDFYTFYALNALANPVKTQKTAEHERIGQLALSVKRSAFENQQKNDFKWKSVLEIPKLDKLVY